MFKHPLAGASLGMCLAASLLVAAPLGFTPARAWAQSSSPGQIAPDNQDADNQPALQSMQTVGGASNRPGLNVQGRLSPEPNPDALRAGPPAGAPARGGLVATSQARDCRAEDEALSKRGVPASQRRGVMRTCEADQNMTADLPSARATFAAPDGATGQCKDGSYTAAIKGAAACDGHGGLSHWL